LNQKNSPTIRDIAKEAGVSIATISRYLNKSGYVDIQTLERIEEVITRFNYIPSRMAQSLKTRKSRQLMLIVPDISNPFYSTMAKTVQALAKEKNYTLTLYNTNEDPREEIDSIRTAVEIHAEGIILGSIHVRDEVIDELQKTRIAAVVVNSYEKCPFDAVHGVRGEGTYLSARHLIGLGHMKIAFAGGPTDSAIASSRRFGYRKAIEEAGIPLQEDYCFEMGFSENAGYKAGKYFSTLNTRPTAVCCANDLIALGVLAAFNEAGIRVPEEISLTGMDNISVTNLTRPRLTTVTNDSDEFARSAVRLLFERIDKTYCDLPREVLVSRQLIVRDSTCPPVKL
jgi:DNA-binding LacI/PurR family transcriptional regulator